MCDPTLLMVGATAMSAMSSIQQGKASRQAADAQAGQLDYSARVARDDALAQAQMIRKNQRFAIGASDAAAAASGVKVGEGSAGEANRQIYQDTEHDAFMAILNGDRRARGQEIEASLTRTAGKNAQRNANLSAFGTVLGGASKSMNTTGWATASPSYPGDGLSQGNRRAMGVY